MIVVFLDRDGVINEDPANAGYITSWSKFKFIPVALKAICRLTEEGFKLAIISNQAGVAKGVMTEKDLYEITRHMLKEIERNNGRIHSVQYCIHKDEDNCDCRKPKTGLFRKALEAIGYRLEVKNSLQPTVLSLFFIGDSERDIIAGKNFGCRTILVLSGKIKTESEANNWQLKPDYIAKDIYEGVDYICSGRDRA